MRQLAFLFSFFIAGLTATAQSYQKNFGGGKFDRALFIDHTNDDGYIVCGYSSSFSNSNDAYLVKLNKAGDVQWQKTFGGSRTDIGWGVHELKDKTYLLFGAIGIDSTNDDIFITHLMQMETRYGKRLMEMKNMNVAHKCCQPQMEISYS